MKFPMVKLLTLHQIYKGKATPLQTIASASSDGELHGGIALYQAILKMCMR